MKNPRKARESAMRDILRTVILSQGLPESSELDLSALDDCCRFGYLSGVQVRTMISGRLVAEVQTRLRVTKAGLDFLFPPRDTRFVVSTAIATASCLLNLLQAFL